MRSLSFTGKDARADWKRVLAPSGLPCWRRKMNDVECFITKYGEKPSAYQLECGGEVVRSGYETKIDAMMDAFSHAFLTSGRMPTASTLEGHTRR